MAEEHAEESVLDAVNLALGDAATQPEEPAHDEHTDAEGTAAPGDDTGDAGADDADSEGGEDSDLDGAERNADGTFKAKPDAAADEVKLDKNGKPIPEVKKSDPINDPIPKELKAETQDRMRSLIKTAKELTAERDQVKTDFDYIIKGIEASGSTPQQYGEVLSWMQLFNSNDPAQQSKALELVESVADRLATLLGKERASSDPLAAHADLKEAVARNQITAQYAKEIARTRNAQGFRTQIQSAHQTEQQQQQAAQQAVVDAKTGLNAQEATLRSTDPQYEAKRAALVPVLQPLFRRLHPSQWNEAFADAYKKIQVPAAAPAKRGVPANQPMRAGKNPAGGQGRAPASMGEAINAALAGMK